MFPLICETLTRCVYDLCVTFTRRPLDQGRFHVSEIQRRDRRVSVMYTHAGLSLTILRGSRLLYSVESVIARHQVCFSVGSMNSLPYTAVVPLVFCSNRLRRRRSCGKDSALLPPQLPFIPARELSRENARPGSKPTIRAIAREMYAIHRNHFLIARS